MPGRLKRELETREEEGEQERSNLPKSTLGPRGQENGLYSNQAREKEVKTNPWEREV